MKKIPTEKRRALLNLISRLSDSPSSDDLLDVFNKGKEMYFGDILDSVHAAFELTRLDVKFIVVSMRKGDHMNKRFKIKLPEHRKVSLEDFETIYTYMILGAFGNDPDQELSKVECIHRSIFGEPLVKSVVFKVLRMMVEYTGKNLSYIKTRDYEGATYTITARFRSMLDSIQATTRNEDGSIVVYTTDPNFEELLLQLDA